MVGDAEGKSHGDNDDDDDDDDDDEDDSEDSESRCGKIHTYFSQFYTYFSQRDYDTEIDDKFRSIPLARPGSANAGVI